jgi:hypothetical protein
VNILEGSAGTASGTMSVVIVAMTVGTATALSSGAAACGGRPATPGFLPARHRWHPSPGAVGTGRQLPLGERGLPLLRPGTLGHVPPELTTGR